MIELKPWLHEAEVVLSDTFTLHLALDFAAVNQLEGLLGKGIDDLLGELGSSASLLTKFLWAVTRKHHPDLSLDHIAGIQFSKDYGTTVAATLGDLVRRAFDLTPTPAPQPVRKARAKKAEPVG